MTAGNVGAPFLNSQSFKIDSEIQELETRYDSTVRSPFLSVYEMDESEGGADQPLREAYASVVDHLDDEEFDEAVFELETEARTLYQDHLSSGYSPSDTERVVAQRFSQLLRESEAMVDAAAREFSSRNGAGITDNEVTAFEAGYSSGAPVEPAFENFFGKLIKKVGKVVKTVAKGAAKLGLGPILNSIKALIKPLLNRVLQKAIGKLPETVQPAARMLAQKLGFAAPPPPQPAAPEPVATTGEPATGGETAGLQQEFDEQVAAAMLAEDEAELNMEVVSFAREASAPANPVFANLESAREKFIQELETLRSGESPEPHIQNFLPAVLPALRLGMRILGRPKVVNFLSPLLAKLIANLVGPDQASALSTAIVDAGLKLLNLELSEQEKSGLGASAVAATVEETIQRVAGLPGYMLDNQELLEGFALEAFEQAAAANLPAVLSESMYKQRPNLLEAGVNAGWVLMPLRGPKRYKRCSRTFKVRITPHLADEVETFEGVPLADYLQDQLGVAEGEDVEAEVRLYEALPGTSLSDIARSESDVQGLGASDQASLSQFHLLTHEAASALLSKPGLGRGSASGSDRQNVAPGQRVFHLALTGRRPLTVPGHAGRRRVRRLFHINVTLDGLQGAIRVCVYFSEVKAQKLAVSLRQQSHTGTLSVAFQKALARRLPSILHGKRPRRLRIVHPQIPPGRTPESIVQKLPGVVPMVFVSKLQEWLVQAFHEFIKTQAQKFVAATEDPADGVTVRFTIEHAQGLKEIGQALVEKGPSGSAIAEKIGQGGTPVTRVEVFSGHRCG